MRTGQTRQCGSCLTCGCEAATRPARPLAVRAVPRSCVQQKGRAHLTEGWAWLHHGIRSRAELDRYSHRHSRPEHACTTRRCSEAGRFRAARGRGHLRAGADRRRSNAPSSRSCCLPSLVSSPLWHPPSRMVDRCVASYADSSQRLGRTGCNLLHAQAAPESGAGPPVTSRSATRMSCFDSGSGGQSSQVTGPTPATPRGASVAVHVT